MVEASGHILLIEDDPMLTELYQTKLELEAFQVSVATDGKEGLALARRVKPDLILLDIMLPEMNGFEVLKKLGEQAVTKQIPVIVLTNLGGERADSDKRLALSLGAKEFLVKTFHLPDDIVGKIKTTLGTRAKRKATAKK
ncbi:MAG: response regulator [bacterium]|nr:response regulator [bacterium]MDZ4248143.1 response regulator [Patescibacteria group bacterium]